MDSAAHCSTRPSRLAEGRRTRDRWLAAAIGAFAWLCVVSPGGAGERGFRGCLAVRGGRVLAAEQHTQLFVPGSVLKLVVAAAALHHWGPDHRLNTTLESAGTRVGDTLRGDLVLRAAGDPTWNERFFPADPRAPLHDLARQLAAQGIARVEGDLVLEVSRFPGRAFPMSWSLAEVPFAYAAPTSALAIDENALTATIAAGSQLGAPATMTSTGPWEFVNHTRTVGGERHGKGTVEFLPDWGSTRIVVRGEYPQTEPPYRLELSVPHPEWWAAQALLSALAARGVTLTGEIRWSLQPLPPAFELARITSPSLAERLAPILVDSHNWYAEMLLRGLAAAVRGEGRSDSGLELLREFLLETVGVASDAFVLEDASGVSPYNLISPEAVVQLLTWAWQQPWRETWIQALPQNGVGTLTHWPNLPPLAAKTGTVRHTAALAGYLDDPRIDRGARPAAFAHAAEPVVFACFLNHRTQPVDGLRAEIAAWLRQGSTQDAAIMR